MVLKAAVIATILLALCLMMFSPFVYNPTAHATGSATFQTVETNWTPIGPRMDNILITDEHDFLTMWGALQNGQEDLSDWPLNPTFLNTFSNNPDMYITAKQAEFGNFELDVNHFAPIFGISQQTPRAKVAAVLSTGTATANSCGTGLGSLSVMLINRETGFNLTYASSSTVEPHPNLVTGGHVVKDTFNIVSLHEFPFGSPVFSATDSTASGTYTFSCVTANPQYTIGSTEYNTTTVTVTTTGGTSTNLAVVAVTAGQTLPVTLTVSYNSPSTVNETLAGIYARRAISHMLDKPNFVNNDSQLSGTGGPFAVCLDQPLPPGDGLKGSGCIPQATPCPNTTNNCGFDPSTLESIECGPLSSIDSGFTSVACNSSNYISAYNIGPTSSIGATQRWWNQQGVATSGYASPNNIEAACDYILLAGQAAGTPFSLTPSGSTCAQLATQSSLTTAPTNPIHIVPPTNVASIATFYIRTSLPREHFGQVFADTVNLLFGTANGICVPNGTTNFSAVNYGQSQSPQVCAGTVTPQYYTIDLVVPIVFEDSGKAKWNFYTGGFSLDSTPEFLWTNFHSTFASAVCGGPFSSFPTNYNYHCDPQYDAVSTAAYFASSILASNPIFNQTAYLSMTTAEQVPVYTSIDQFAELNCWNWQSVGSQASLVRTFGHGTELGFWSLYNMQPNPSYTPTNPSLYSCGGQGQTGFVPETIRRGLSQATDNMDPMEALTVWDFEIISQVFDSMLTINPISHGATEQVFDWMTQSHSVTHSNTQWSCIGAPTVVPTVCTQGTDTEIWHLRHDLFFQDGTQVNANDICYSIIAARDVVAALLYGSVFNVASCTTQVGQGTVGNPDTAVVTLQSPQGICGYCDLFIGQLPIVPAHGPHSWATFPSTGFQELSDVGGCGGPLVQSTLISPSGQTPYTSIPAGFSSYCADPRYDPMAAGQMVGSGPWQCNNTFGGTGSDGQTPPGTSGGPCTSTGNAVIDTAQTALLVANEKYMRGPSNSQTTSANAEIWSDKFSEGQVDIRDIADAALDFGTSNAYWANPLYTCSGSTTVDICAVGTAAGFFGAGITSPFPETGTGNLQQIDMSGIASSIGGTTDANVESGEFACTSYACISAIGVKDATTGNLDIRLGFGGSTAVNTISLSNVGIQIGSGAACVTGGTPTGGNPSFCNFQSFTTPVTVTKTGSTFAATSVATGLPYTSGSEITLQFNVVYNGVTVGTTAQLYHVDVQEG